MLERFLFATMLRKFIFNFFPEIHFNSFLPFMRIVICSLICLCILIAYIANNMDPDQTAKEQSDQVLPKEQSDQGS